LRTSFPKLNMSLCRLHLLMLQRTPTPKRRVLAKNIVEAEETAEEVEAVAVTRTMKRALIMQMIAVPIESVSVVAAAEATEAIIEAEDEVVVAVIST
jgi:hypothetical protein